MTGPSVVEDLAADSERILDLVRSAGDLSFELAVDLRLRRVLVVSIASLFEEQIKDLIHRFCSQASNNCAEMLALTRSQVTARGYHTLFNWKASNANQFFGIFGTSFSERARADMDNTEDLKEGSRAFLQLGALRNELVHGNFETAPMDLTMDEILERHEAAKVFLEYLEHQLMSVACGRAEEE